MKSMNEGNKSVFLLSQLEEPKFARLFRHLVDAPDGLNRPSVPLDVRDAELHLKITGEVSALRSWAVAQLFQVAHLPYFLRDSGDLFIERRLRQAFQGLKTCRTLEKALDAFASVPDRSVYRLYPTIEQDAYYFVTNIGHGLDDAALEKFTAVAHKLYSEVMNVAEDRHPVFGIGTPETMFNAAPSELDKIMVELLNMPSNYYFIAREGQIAVVPTTEHGAFLVSSGTKSARPITGLSTVVTSTLSPECSPNASALSDLKALIDSKRTKEHDIQCFLEANPYLLFALDERYCEIRSHVCLFDVQGNRLVPDFMARVEDSEIWDIIELKRPQHPLTVFNHGKDRPSAFAARAIAELLQYRDFFSIHANRNKILKTFGTAPYEPCLVLVIGRGRSTDHYEWRTTLAGFPRVQVVSYDYLFQRAGDCNAFIKKATCPSSNSVRRPRG